MSEAFVKIDLHGLRQEEAMKVIDKAIASAGSTTYQLQLIHGYNRGTSLRSMTGISTNRRSSGSCPATIPGLPYLF